jgi:hypothetical protein
LKNDIATFKRALLEYEYISLEDTAPGAQVWLPRGLYIINSIKTLFCNLHSASGGEQIGLPDVLRRVDVEVMDSIYPISHKYFSLTENTKLAATHEAAFFTFARSYLKRHVQTNSLFMYNIGGMYRRPKKAPSPFNLGERVCFLEAYYLYKYQVNDGLIIEIMNDIVDNLVNRYLHIPNIFVIRPKRGNLPFASQTRSYECILPVGKTLCCGMVYAQADNLTSRFLGRDFSWRSVHSAITDYTLMSFLMSYFFEDGFDFPSMFTYVHIEVIYEPANLHALERSEQIAVPLRHRGARVKLTPARHIQSAAKHALFSGVRCAFGVYENKSGQIEIIKYSKTGTERVSLEHTINVDFESDHRTIARAKSRAELLIRTCNNISDVNDAIRNKYVARMAGYLSELEDEAFVCGLQGGELVGYSGKAAGSLIFSRRI